MSGFLLGVLGGMGPLATVDLLDKIISQTAADNDQQHAPVVIWNVPQIADRQRALAGTGPSPLPALREGIARLNGAGASHILIACNTAHHWYLALAEDSRAPIVHIADAILPLLQAASGVRQAGLIATQGTLDAGWYQQRLTDVGIKPLLPTAKEMTELFVPGCYAVKQGRLAQGGELLSELCARLNGRGAERLILACTEVAPALAAVQSRYQPLSLDTTLALAQAGVRLWLEHRPAVPAAV